MAEYIERDQAREVICGWCEYAGSCLADDYYWNKCDAKRRLDDIPSADVQPVVHGHWKMHDICSVAEIKPCPFCGSEEVHTAINTIDNWFVMCEGCGASGRDERTEEKAIASWNKRYEDGLTFCRDCRWFEDSPKKGMKGECKLHKIKAGKNDYCSAAWREIC